MQQQEAIRDFLVKQCAMSHAGGRLSYRGNRRAGTTVKISEVAEQKHDGMMEWSWGGPRKYRCAFGRSEGDLQALY